jgi:hypothetical protein
MKKKLLRTKTSKRNAKCTHAISVNLSAWLGCTYNDIEKVLFMAGGDDVLNVLQPFANKIKEWETSYLLNLIIELKTLQSLKRIEGALMKQLKINTNRRDDADNNFKNN